ncbi:testis-specific serine kinase substrate isoform X2 [Anolis carolinensis]|uniref:testis-specific serine kinase substrate isoform X2 n=1 Tax=Anolis carolinensis TaxID=28377 RepID=UPI0004629C5F|nr:PREDICTED: testis-specific serine kinase substrate isoform X2 [Anolis carolinensis]|eukprot:XP_008111813.1 PREDICTED: testis-specific serine kinase substrate isoform X2 [Anolis carolinensis]
MLNPAMSSFVVKTIWQSKEINEAGDTPPWACSRPHGSKEQLGSKPSGTKAFPKKKKAVSFHGVEPHLASENSKLNLKRSSACTNVSLLNLTDGERDDSTTENESTDDGSPPGGAAGERSAPLPPIKSVWSEYDDDDDTSSQQEVSNSGLLRAKDSITSLKERTSKVNRHVQNLQSECTVLCENLERRRQEAEDLEEYCTQLKEKLRFLQRQVQVEDLSRQGREWQELEQRMASGISKQLLDLVSNATAIALRPSNSEEGELPPPTAAILASINNLRVALENGHMRAGLGDEVSIDGKSNTASTLACIPLLEEIRKCVLELSGQSQREALTQKEVLRLLAQLGVRLEGLIPQWERTQVEHSQALRMLREELDEVSATVKRTSVSLTQLRADLDGVRQVKPLLEEVSRHLSVLKPLETPERQTVSCARCSSYSFVNTESLRQMVEQAVAPILEELKQRTPPPGTCPSCQLLQKKIMDLEQSALDIHARAEVLSSNVRLAHDEALRANYLEQARIGTDKDKSSSLDYLQNKQSSLNSQLVLVSQEGMPQSPAVSLAANVALTKRSSCPGEMDRQPQ